MPVIKQGSPDPHPGQKRPRSQLSNGSTRTTLVPSPPGSISRPVSWPPPGAWPQPGAWSQQYLQGPGGGGGGPGGPTVNIPDSRYGYTSPIPSNIYGQVRTEREIPCCKYLRSHDLNRVWGQNLALSQMFIETSARVETP